MGALANCIGVLPPTGEVAMATTRAVEAALMELPQVELQTEHQLHAGVYARTVKIPAGVAITGALIKIPTVLIVSGKLMMSAGDKCIHVNGFASFNCPAGRKQIMVAEEDSYVTMVFASSAKTVEEAEEEFTDEVDLLMSRKE